MKASLRRIVGKRIRECRKKAGLTQAKLAERVGIDYKYIQKIEGKNPPALIVDTIERLAKALKVKPESLLRD